MKFTRHALFYQHKVLVFCSFISLFTVCGNAYTSEEKSLQPYVMTTGTATRFVEADIALLWFEVSASSNSVKSSIEAVTSSLDRFWKEIESLLAIMPHDKASFINKNTTFALYPQYRYSDRGEAYIDTFRAVRRIKVPLADLQMLPTIISALEHNREMILQCLVFSASHAAAIRSELRKEAIANATQLATELANSFHSQLDTALRINYLPETDENELENSADGCNQSASNTLSILKMADYSLPYQVKFQDQIDVIFNLKTP